MAQYVIYKYEFVKTGEKELFQPGEGGVRLDTPDGMLEYFGEELAKKKTLNLYKTKRAGDATVYPNNIIRSCGGVTVMRVCNVKYVTLVKEYRKSVEESNPWCNVIIDARPGVAQIAIERSGAFESDTDKVRDIFQESLHAALARYGFSIEIRVKIRVADFWETVERQVYERKDTVRRVVFDFPDPYEAGPADASPGELERLHLIASLSRATGAAKASLKMEATRKGTLLLDRTKEDLVRMVSLCCANGYGISVYFRQMGLYRYGKEACAIYEIGESLINDFANGQRTIGSGAGEAYALTERLDYIREQTKDYGDAKKTGRKGNRKHRRAV